MCDMGATNLRFFFFSRHALALASAGPTSRARHAGFISKAFGTVDHPFRGIENGPLEEAIRIAYSGVSRLYFYCNGINGH